MAATRLGRSWGTGWRRWPADGSNTSGALTSLRRSGPAKFLATAALMGMLLVGAGCSTWGPGDRYEGRIRPAATETSRLLSNAHYYKLMGRPEAALKEMEEAHRADPDNLKIVDSLARNYQELGQFQRAQELYKEALARQGSNQALQNNFCYSFYLQGNPAKAEACFKEALERDPSNIAARNNLGLLWCRQGKLAEAQRLWEEAEGNTGAQNRMNQALAFLGKAPATYAKLPEPKPQPQSAAKPKPAAPVTVASVPKPEPTVAQAPVKASPPAQKVTAPPKVETKEAAKPAAPLPKPAAPVILASKQAAVPAPPAATTPKVESKEAVKPAEPKPATPPPATVKVKPAAPVTVASVPKPEAPVAPAPVKASPLAQKVTAPPKVETKEAAKPAAPLPKPAAPVILASKQAAVPVPPAANTPKVESKEAVKPAEPKPATPPPATVKVKPAAPVTVASVPKPVPAAAPAPVKTSPPAQKVTALPKVEQKEAAKPVAPLPKPAAPVILASKQATVPAPPAVTTPKLEQKVAARAMETKPTPQPQPAVAPKPAASPVFLTTQERRLTGIEVRNGTWTKNLARETRSLLSREGYHVALIGNHIDFGVESTVIYYRPGAEKVARALTAEIFPGARMEQISQLKNGVAVKVLLGRDLLDQAQTMARISGGEREISPPVAPVAKPLPQPCQEIAKEPAAPTTLEAPAKPEPVAPPLQVSSADRAALPPVALSGLERQTPVETPASKGVLTAEELINTAIEIRNGTRAQNLAHRTRSLLSQEGFTVGIIGNHIDFGAEYTLIYYRPEAEKVARALNSQIFPGARLTPSLKLNHGMSIKVVLGHDLLERPRLMSRLAAE